MLDTVERRVDSLPTEEMISNRIDYNVSSSLQAHPPSIPVDHTPLVEWAWTEIDERLEDPVYDAIHSHDENIQVQLDNFESEIETKLDNFEDDVQANLDQVVSDTFEAEMQTQLTRLLSDVALPKLELHITESILPTIHSTI